MRTFEAIVNSIPIDKDELAGKAVTWFVMKQQPTDVKFKKHPNGVTIQMKMEENDAETLREYWREYVNPHLQK